MSYVPQVPRRPVPTYDDFSSQVPAQAAHARVDLPVDPPSHLDTSDEAYEQAMRVIAARQAQSSFVQDPAARQNEGLASPYAYEMQAPALPQRRQPAPTAPMRVPEPVYIGRQPDVYVFGGDNNHMIDNGRVHIDHNRRAYALHEAQLAAASTSAQRPTGRAAHWRIQEWMGYTTDIQSTGMSKDQLDAFQRDIIHVWNQGAQQKWNYCLVASAAILCFLPLLCDGTDGMKQNAWDASYTTQRLSQVCQQHNAALAQANVRAFVRHEQIPGVGWFLDIHHTG